MECEEGESLRSGDLGQARFALGTESDLRQTVSRQVFRFDTTNPGLLSPKANRACPLNEGARRYSASVSGVASSYSSSPVRSPPSVS